MKIKTKTNDFNLKKNTWKHNLKKKESAVRLVCATFLALNVLLIKKSVPHH